MAKRKKRKNHLRAQIPNGTWRLLNGGVEMPFAPPRPEILSTRESTHGSFAQNAQVSQDIKTILRAAGYLSLPEVHIEALDMIALKLSRIVSGKSMVKDHWDDVAGYAKLGAEICDS